jgi:hypothetical protein
MCQKRVGGKARYLKDEIMWAERRGCEVTWTAKGHIRFRGPNGGTVIASGTPRSGSCAKRVHGQIENMLSAQKP